MKNYTVLLYAATLLFCSSCKESEIPTVTVQSVEHMAKSFAYCTANIVSQGSSPVTSMGICWSIEPGPTIDNTNKKLSGKKGSFGAELRDLQSYLPYYVRAFATNKHGTAYSNEVKYEPGDFETPCFPNTNNVEFRSKTYDYSSVYFSHSNDQYEIDASGTQTDFKIYFTFKPESGVYYTTNSYMKDQKGCSIYALFSTGPFGNNACQVLEGQKIRITQIDEDTYNAIFCDLILFDWGDTVYCSGNLTTK